MAPQGAAYNVDWVLSNNSNVHACNHRDWFINFIPFKSRGGSYLQGAGLNIEGVGDVELEIRRVADNKTKISPRSSKIILRDVVFCPTAPTNIVGMPITHDYDIRIRHEEGGGGTLTEKGTGRLVGLFDSPVLIKLLLKGQFRGQTSLEPQVLYAIHIIWPEAEKQRWQEFQRSSGASVAAEALSAGSGAATIAGKAEKAPYTEEEKKWLKEKDVDEFKFLRAFGLSIHKEEDRQEGRAIVRQLMQFEEKGEDEDGSQDSRSSFERELEEDPMSHLADYAFTEPQLDWIKKHYRHSGNFLLCYGLRPYEDDHCKDGARLVEQLMEEN